MKFSTILLTRSKRAARSAATSDSANRESSINENSVKGNSIINVNTLPDNAIASTSAGVISPVNNRVESVSSGSEGRPWNINNSNIQETGTSVQVYNLHNYSGSSSGTPDPTRISKIVRDIIPAFDGRNMSVKMFTEHCRAAISMVSLSPLEIPYLTMLIKTKITGEARVHIQDRVGMRT